MIKIILIFFVSICINMNALAIQRAEQIQNLLIPTENQLPIKLYVVFLRGNAAFDGINNPKAGEAYLNLIKSVGKLRNYKITTENLWWNWQSGLCERILKSNSDRVVVVGHSAGSNGSRSLARCLGQKKKQIDLLITVAAFDYSEPVTEKDVNVHINYIVETIFLSGSEKVSNGTSKTLNYWTRSSSEEWAHIYITSYMYPLLVLQTFAELEGQGHRIVIPKNFVAQDSFKNLPDYIIK